MSLDAMEEDGTRSMRYGASLVGVPGEVGAPAAAAAEVLKYLAGTRAEDGSLAPAPPPAAGSVSFCSCWW